MLCGLWVDLKVVSMVSTSRPQFDNRGWQVEQEACVRMLWFWWQAKQLRPS